MPNRLAKETSPYLVQHAGNPVDWYPWGEEALRQASTDDKPILLSIGYSACHWCHVMAHESFENEVVARLMNDNFVNVKVDREERPDLDAVYMEAVVVVVVVAAVVVVVAVAAGHSPIGALKDLSKEATILQVASFVYGIRKRLPLCQAVT